MKKSVPAASPDAYVASLEGWQGACVESLREAVRALPIEPRLKPGGKYEMASLELRDDVSVEPATVRRLTKKAAALNRTLGDPTQLRSWTVIGLALGLTAAAQLAFTSPSAAADVRHLSFDWPKPTMSTTCGLSDPERAKRKAALRFAGAVERQDMGVACVVHIPRRRFDALYRFCTVSDFDSLTRERYACWVQYSPAQVTFLYSYSPEEIDAPKCEFACSPQ